MSQQPSFIIEMRNGGVDSVYSYGDISFLVIDWDNLSEDGRPSVKHYTPTLAISDLTRLYSTEPQILNQLESPSDPVPYF